MRRAAFFLITTLIFLGAGLGAGNVLGLGETARADYLDKHGIVRWPDGRVRLMSHFEALEACPPGTHLPTAREFATMAQSLGSQGILELTDLKRGERPPEWYYLVEAENADGMRDTFFFNSRGYDKGKLPDSDLAKNFFWSSSISPSDVWDFAYHFDGLLGTVYFGERDGIRGQSAARCIQTSGSGK